MLAAPGFSWPILFEQNHLRITQAHTNRAKVTVHFRDPPLGFTIKYSDSNSLQTFPSLSSPKCKLVNSRKVVKSSSIGLASCHMSSNCISTPMQSQRHVILHERYNLVSFLLCFAYLIDRFVPFYSSPLAGRQGYCAWCTCY